MTKIYRIYPKCALEALAFYGQLRHNELMNPLLINLPDSIITPRLILRHARAGDGKEMNEAIQASFNELKEFIPWAKKIPSPEESELVVRKSHSNWILREDLHVMVCERTSQKIIGGSGLHRINWKIPSFEIGYWISTEHAGKGYATECALALTHFCFKHLNAKRVEIRCDSLNTKSFRVAEKLGYQLEGHLKKNSLHPNETELRDTLVYARLNLDHIPDLSVTW